VVIAVALDGQPADLVRTGADGTFEYFAPPAERVWLGANVIGEGDAFEPAELEVAFGTRGLLFGRTAKAELRVFEVEVRDRITGEEVESFVATIGRGPGTERWNNSYAHRRRFELRVLPDSRWLIKSHGYIARELRLAEALAELEPGERLTVELDPGLDHTFRILDADTNAPVAGVVMRSATAGEVRSDASGRVHLVSDHWSTYRMTKEGYEPEDWDPDDWLLWGNGTFLYSRP
jgi:hypothetical protein